MEKRLSSAAVAALCCLTWVSGCASNDGWSSSVPSPNGEQFASEVYPLLLRDCAFSECHGAKDRFFQVFGPGRNRLDPDNTKPDGPATLTEVLHSYDRARSMLATSTQVEQALLLSKPLELAAGGQGHRGADGLGRNVFASTREPGYVTLLRWARSRGDRPTAEDLDAALTAAMEAAP